MAVTERLVRDRVPEMDRRGGGDAAFRTADRVEIGSLLLRKMREGCEELAAADQEDVPSRAADVIEVVLAYARHMGQPEDLVDHVRRIKLKNHGGFEAGQVRTVPG